MLVELSKTELQTIYSSIEDGLALNIMFKIAKSIL